MFFEINNVVFGHIDRVLLPSVPKLPTGDPALHRMVGALRRGHARVPQLSRHSRQATYVSVHGYRGQGAAEVLQLE
jgi:hypothetical protein